jgi:gluconate 2-dehydrogenase gamma chain
VKQTRDESRESRAGGMGVGGLELPALSRRDLLRAAAVAPLAFVPFTSADGARAALHALAALEDQAQGAPYKPKYFKPDEWKEVRVLVDLIIPRDERSGSATEAGVPEFMDWICNEYPSYSWVREALRWLDGFAYDTHSQAFARLPDKHRRELLDQIAWPAKARPDLREGVNHFNRLRDFTASGFFSSRMGVKDLQYIGNVALPEWPGCPKPALDHLDVSY